MLNIYTQHTDAYIYIYASYDLPRFGKRFRNLQPAHRGLRRRHRMVAGGTAWGGGATCLTEAMGDVKERLLMKDYYGSLFHPDVFHFVGRHSPRFPLARTTPKSGFSAAGSGSRTRSHHKAPQWRSQFTQTRRSHRCPATCAKR